MLTTITKSIIRKIIPNIDKLNLLLDAVKDIKLSDNGSVHITYRNNVVIETEGSLIHYTKDGYHIMKAKQTWINPKIENFITIEDNIDNNVILLKHECDLSRDKKPYVDIKIHDKEKQC